MAKATKIDMANKDSKLTIISASPGIIAMVLGVILMMCLVLDSDTFPSPLSIEVKTDDSTTQTEESVSNSSSDYIVKNVINGIEQKIQSGALTLGTQYFKEKFDGIFSDFQKDLSSTVIVDGISEQIFTDFKQEVLNNKDFLTLEDFEKRMEEILSHLKNESPGLKVF
jgi:hypothetical protein